MGSFLAFQIYLVCVLLESGAAQAHVNDETQEVSTGDGKVGHERGNIRGSQGRRHLSSVWVDMMHKMDAPLFDFNILVTGYLPFLNFTVNPAFEAMEVLNGTCDTVYLQHPRTFRLCYEGMPLPVSLEGSTRVAGILENDPYKWDGIIHLGFESSAKGLRLETIAANVLAAEENGHIRNADVPCNKKGTPYKDIYEVEKSRHI
ncbi:unnamed protein product [Choristocarpus tenellus]